MKHADIAIMRLTSQHIDGTRLTTINDVISHMGAMQAQDFPMAKWALGLRLPGSSEAAIDEALDRAELLRTHMLRPTWHFVAPQDIHWLLELTASQIKASQRARDRQLELSEAVYSKSNSTIEKSLEAGGHLTRQELVTALNKAGLATDQNRASHLLMHAELDKIICSGIARSGKPTYALLSQRVPKPRNLDREEALAELACRYFTSRCPATLQDFTWWSGLPAVDARQALNLVKPGFLPENIDGREYWLPTHSPPLRSRTTAFLVSPFDELIVSYRDRTASIAVDDEKQMKAISNRGVFWPVMMVNGHIEGIWKRTLTKDIVIIELQPFRQLDHLVFNLLKKAADKYGHFIARQVELLPANQ